MGNLSVSYYPNGYREIYTTHVEFPSLTFDVVIQAPASTLPYYISVTESTTGNVFYLDGEGGLSTTAVTKTQTQWSADTTWSTNEIVYPVSTILNFYPGPGTSALTKTVTANNDTVDTIVLVTPSWEDSTIPLNFERINIRHRWEVRGIQLDQVYDGLYKDLAELLGVYNSSGTLTSDGLVINAMDDIAELESNTLSSTAVADRLNIPSIMQSLNEKALNPII